MPNDFVFLPHRSVLSLTGPDTLQLLERLVTNDTTDWSPGIARYGALLTPQGKVLADYLALRTEDGVLLDVDKGQCGDLIKRLKLFRLRSKVEIEPEDDLFVIAAVSPGTDVSAFDHGLVHGFTDPRYPGGRRRGFATSESWTASGRESLQQDSKPLSDYHADRIAHGIPEQGGDFGQAEVFPADINMDVLGGVALNKGCFVGQEVVSRMHRRGQIRKRTLPVSLSPDAELVAGTEIVATAPIGTLTSLTPGHALARLRVDRLSAAEASDIKLTANDVPVVIEKPDWLLEESRTEAPE